MAALHVHVYSKSNESASCVKDRGSYNVDGDQSGVSE